jgi:hypothetical protein
MDGRAGAPGGAGAVKKLAFVLGLVGALLGGMWLLQGLGTLQLRPILCFADCAPLQGSSTRWAVIGALVFTAGSVAVWWSLRSRA